MKLCFGGKVHETSYLLPVKRGLHPTDVINHGFHTNIMKMLKKAFFPLNSSQIVTEVKHLKYQRVSKSEIKANVLGINNKVETKHLSKWGYPKRVWRESLSRIRNFCWRKNKGMGKIWHRGVATFFEQKGWIKPNHGKTTIRDHTNHKNNSHPTKKESILKDVLCYTARMR